MSHILVVEDESAIAELISINLRHAGFEVTIATNAEQAQAAVDGVLPDLIILDWMLPGQSGLALAKRWRGEQRTRELPVIMLTARADETDKIAGLDAGADDYLVKPISIDELAARLRAIGRRTAGRAQALWRHGVLAYDPATREVLWQGTKVELTPRECALLEVFLSHPQRVLSKALLQEKLYDWSGDEPESNALEVHIHHLRRKIQPGIVRTVRGVGYVLGVAEGDE